MVIAVIGARENNSRTPEPVAIGLFNSPCGAASRCGYKLENLEVCQSGNLTIWHLQVYVYIQEEFSNPPRTVILQVCALLIFLKCATPPGPVVVHIRDRCMH